MTTQNRQHRIKNSYGMINYFNYYVKNYKGTVNTYSKFAEVLNKINQAFANEFADTGYEIKLPKRMGMMCISKRKGIVWINNEGKVCSNRPINYKATKELWANNSEAKEKKQVIRLENKHTDGYQFRIYYKRVVANYRNKSIYTINPNRTMSRRFSKNIRNGKIDPIFLNK